MQNLLYRICYHLRINGILCTFAHYTKDVLQQMKAVGAEPDMIQTGNEISYGMLWGTRAAVGNGSTNRCWPSSSAENWTRFTNLLKQAIKACREESPESKIIIHTERTSISQQKDNTNYAALSNFYKQMKSAGIDYDIIGLSYYPYFHGAISELEGAINLLEKDYSEKSIMVVEFGYPVKWAVDGTMPLSSTVRQEGRPLPSMS